MYKLKCKDQNYSWGKKGSLSLVSNILKSNDAYIEENKNYAEYWMGTHINGPSFIESKNITLQEFISTIDNYELPFLLKVLSINDPLSIQVHPDKQFAKVLHNLDSINYKDANHKPEMAIAVSDEFKLIYGLIPISDATSRNKILIDNIFLNYIDIKLRAIENEQTYKEFIIELIKLEDETSKQIITLIFEKQLFKDDDVLQNLINLLYNKFGKDKGILFALFMNYYNLKKGEALFISSNIPHAYIDGDCIECMANSDNVIRLGLTPKFVDSENFIKILINHFDDMVQKEIPTIGFNIDDKCKFYKHELYDDFNLYNLKLINNDKYTFINDNHSIIFILNGSCRIKSKNDDNFNLSIRKYECYYITKDFSLDIFCEEDCSLFIASN